MKANSRRRVLISSMAMLLVALVALSTATYAWFTANTTATANNMKVKTSKASKLVICDDTQEWTTLLDYGHDKSLLPVSSADGSNWYKAVAKSATDGTADGAATKITSGLGAYVLVDQLNVMNQGDTQINGVTIQVTGLSEYARIALVEVDGQGTDKEQKSGSKDFDESVISASKVTYNALTGTNVATDVQEITTNTILVDGKFSVGDLAKDQAKFYNLYVWFEGQDFDADSLDTSCYDGNQLTLSGIEFTVTGTPAA